jgi:hypothetical protein
MTWRRGRWISATGRAGDGDAVGICMPGVITCPGVGDGDAAGISMPGAITCGLGEGDAAGICIPGVMTCGVGDGEGLGLAILRVVVRLARGVLFFGVARPAFGVAFGLGMTCPSCCGKAVLLSATTIAIEQNACSILFVSTDQFIFTPMWRSRLRDPKVLFDCWNKWKIRRLIPTHLRTILMGTKCGKH